MFVAEKDDVLTWAALASNPNNKEDPIDQAVFRGFEQHFGAARAAEVVAQYKVREAPSLLALDASCHVISLCRTREATINSLSPLSSLVLCVQVHQFMGFNPVIKRTVVKVTHQGQPLVIAKGLLNKVLDTRHGLDQQQIAAGETDDGELQWQVERFADVAAAVTKADVKLAVAGYKTIAVAVRRPPDLSRPHEGPMVLAGIVPMLDPPRHDTALTVHRIRSAHIDVKMITGDHLNIAKETSRLISLGTNVLPSTSLWPASAQRDELILNADGFAQVLPKDKKEVVMVLQNMGMVSDRAHC